MKTLALIATRKGLFKLNEDKTLQLLEFAGVAVSMVLGRASHDTWYAALDHGHFGVKLHRSDDAGANWQEIASPCYPSVDNAADGDSLELIWSMEFAKTDDPACIWAGTIPGGLFYSSDAGASWTLNQNLWQHKQQHEWFGGGFDHAGIHSICIHPQNHQHISVGVSCAGVWQTEDFGESWSNKAQGMRAAYTQADKQFDPNIQDPHRMVQCDSHPDHLWVQHHNGIFKSSDNSASWQEIQRVSPSTFGFAVAVHPRDENTAWFVPGIKDECRMPVDGKLVVTRTRDSGATFETLSHGLPAIHSSDLVYRHGLDIDNSGDNLIMGSTTGNLWISHDQGDHWECLSNYLPPIYAVSFLK